VIWTSLAEPEILFGIIVEKSMHLRPVMINDQVLVDCTWAKHSNTFTTKHMLEPFTTFELPVSSPSPSQLP